MDIEAQVKILINKYYTEKQQLEKYKKSTEEYNTAIKLALEELQLTEITTDEGLTAKIIIQNREKFNDAKLIDKLKKLGVNEAIKTVEVVDMDALEDSIYNGRLDAANISDCRETTKVTTLKINKKKGA